MRTAAIIVRAALRLFPRQFRDEYAEAMLRDFEERWHDMARGARCLLCVRTLADLTVSAAAEHRRSSFSGSAPFCLDLARAGDGAVRNLRDRSRDVRDRGGRRPDRGGDLVRGAGPAGASRQPAGRIAIPVDDDHEMPNA